MQSGSFLDRVKIYVTAGKGGDGCLSFRREKFIEFGGPNGGCGGRGGDVILQAEPNLTTLLELAYNPHIEAQNGEKGGTYNKTGRAGEDKIIRVPCGTIVKQDGRVIADLTKPGQQFIVARGGMGGRGNQSFKTRNNTAPHIAENGQPGEEVTLILELKVLADLGLVGFPNAGKSTFLSRISAARPRIADYPFTTLNPNLGITLHKGISFATADIPGIIEGASEGKGLGHQFLKHIERTRVLLHVVDPDGFDGMSAEKSVKVIEAELKAFDKKLFAKPRIIVVNKMDLPEAQKAYETIKKKFKKHKVMLMSAATGEGVDRILDEVVKILAATPVEQPVIEEKTAATHKVEPIFSIERDENDVIHITGKKVVEFIAMTNFNQPEAVTRLRGIFKKIGLEKALLKYGVEDGDTLIVGGREFEWNGDFDEEAPNSPEHAGYKRRETKAERLAKRKARREGKK
ncbi:MAG: GTPase ObgE [Elusimicrobia bacterium]|nr:GTPase ObgE [Elusimicrobiota bacterium]MDD7578839.1 GTPase ObgE [Elusimicrobiota bacterium]MDY6039535.1 GTPase ObgE [Elusimicrobiaceae bacterium]